MLQAGMEKVKVKLPPACPIELISLHVGLKGLQNPEAARDNYSIK